MNARSQSKLSSTILAIVFFVLMASLAILHVGPLFRGLDSPQGMEQAQLAREFARGNGLVTKVLRPAAIRQNQVATKQEGTLAEASYNTYHAPLKPILLGLVFKAAGADNFEAWRFNKNEYVYQLDRIVAGFAIVCFLLAIGVTYLLTWRIFDPKIATAVAMMMLLCELYWSVSMSGLPQMLMLLLFSSGCYYAYRAFESTEESKSTIVHSLLAAICFSLLCLTHWLAVWIMIGYAISAALFIRPRGVSGVIALFTLFLAAIFPLLQNVQTSGVIGGTAYLVLFEGLSGSDEFAMRSLESVGLNLRSLALNTLKATMEQTKNLYVYLGAIIAAPIFFISIFHPFKKQPISDFRWAILIMWLFASFGMAFFGLKEEEKSANQLHLLFAPLMAAYGLAMLSVLWSRLNFHREAPALANLHIIVAVILSAGPFLLQFPFEALEKITSKEQTPPNYPPYAPSVLDSSIVDFADPNEIIASDQPWAVAWYTDRTSLWLPMQLSELTIIENMAESEQTPIVGVLTTPTSNGTRPLTETSSYYYPYLSLVLDGWTAVATGLDPRNKLISKQDPELKVFHSQYPFTSVLFFRSTPMILYASRNPKR